MIEHNSELEKEIPLEKLKLFMNRSILEIAEIFQTDIQKIITAIEYYLYKENLNEPPRD